MFCVNWFRTGADGRYLWPGFGENIRVLKWIAERIEHREVAQRTAIGWLPAPGCLDLDGLDLPAIASRQLLELDLDGWREEAERIAVHLDTLGARLPHRLALVLAELRARLGQAGGGAMAHRQR